VFIKFSPPPFLPPGIRGDFCSGSPHFLFSPSIKDPAMDDFPEKRKDARQNYFSPVVYSAQDLEFREYILDISGGGVFIKTRHLLPPGTEINLVIPFPNASYLSLLGVVVRSGEKGIAVQFHKDDLKLIEEVRAQVQSLRLLEQ